MKLLENQNDEHLRAEILQKKHCKNFNAWQLNMKRKTIKILWLPSFMARDNYAYGSTEMIEKLLKIVDIINHLLWQLKFKERFDDGKYSDNELTAVIGILGKIIRVPSEMEYILKESANGKTIEGIFSDGLKIQLQI